MDVLPTPGGPQSTTERRRPPGPDRRAAGPGTQHCDCHAARPGPRPQRPAGARWPEAPRRPGCHGPHPHAASGRAARVTRAASTAANLSVCSDVSVAWSGTTRGSRWWPGCCSPPRLRPGQRRARQPVAVRPARLRRPGGPRRGADRAGADRRGSGRRCTAPARGPRDPADPASRGWSVGGRPELPPWTASQAVLHPYAFGPDDPRGAAYVSTGGDAVAVVVVAPTRGRPGDDAEAVRSPAWTPSVADVAAAPGGTRSAASSGGRGDHRAGGGGPAGRRAHRPAAVAGGDGLRLRRLPRRRHPIVGAVASVAGALASLLGFSYLVTSTPRWSASSPCSGSACRSTTACSSCPATARRPAPAGRPAAGAPVPGRRHRHSEREQRTTPCAAPCPPPAAR